MDSSFMATEVLSPSGNPLDSFMDALRAQIIGEVKADITGDIIERVIRVVASSLQNLAVHQAITVTPSVELSPNITAPTPIVDIELNQDEIVRELKLTRECIEKCMTMLSSPMQRIINRDSEGLIQSVTERHM